MRINVIASVSARDFTTHNERGRNADGGTLEVIKRRSRALVTEMVKEMTESWTMEFGRFKKAALAKST